MIRLHRPPAVPAYLRGEEVAQLRSTVKKFFDRTQRSRRQERPDFPFFPLEMFSQLMDDLLLISHGKCACCESPMTSTGGATLDRFRPKAGAIGLRGDYSTEHYWWLAYTWENLYPACTKCNKFKGAKFPVAARRARINATLDEIATEQRLLLDPFSDDDRSKHLDFQDNGMVLPLSSQGDVTIATFELNRADLVSARKQVAEEILSQRKTITVREPIDVTRPWSAAAQAVVSRWSFPAGKRQAKAAKQKSPIAPAAKMTWGSTLKEQNVSAKAQALRSRVVTRIAIHNFRGIRDLDIAVDFETGTGAPWTIFLGENGTGKSSILQAIALTLIASDADAPTQTPGRVLKKGESSGWVKVWLDDAPEPRLLEFSKRRRRFRRSGPPFPTVLLGYGATRLLPKSVMRDKRGLVRLENMFDPFRPLIDASLWLGFLDKKSFDYVASALKAVLSLPRSARLRRVRTKASPGVRLTLFGDELSLDELSDGYQSVLGLTCDIIAGLHAASKGALEVAEGLVVLDELGSHLHPRWRMRVVESMRTAFPRIQFIASTHDPLCLRGLENGEAIVLRRTSRKRIFAVPDLPPIKGLRVDQLLTSEYFGLDSTMDPAVERKYRELYRLLALREPSAGQTGRIAALREELKPYGLPGETRRERRLLEIIDKELAELDDQPDPEERQGIRQASEQMIADLNRLSAAKRNA